jgi:hypothetical protein
MTGHQPLLALKPLDVQSDIGVKAFRQEANVNGTGSLWLHWPGSGHDERHVTPATRCNVGDFDFSMTYGCFAATIWSSSKPNSGWKLHGCSVY